MRVTLMVMQIRNGDTSYHLQPLRMTVHKRKLRVRVDELPFPIEPGPFYLGISFATFRIPEEFVYKLHTRWQTACCTILISDGKLIPRSNLPLNFEVPFELGYDEL